MHAVCLPSNRQKQLQETQSLGSKGNLIPEQSKAVVASPLRFPRQTLPRGDASWGYLAASPIHTLLFHAEWQRERNYGSRDGLQERILK